MLGMSACTVQRGIADLTCRLDYSDLSEEEQDSIVREVQQQFPRGGYQQILAILKTQGIFVWEHEIRLSIQRVDPLGVSLRWFTRVER